MPVVVATLTPKPEHYDEVLAAFTEAAAATHPEPGCQLYALHTTEGKVVVIEQYESAEAIAAHTAAPALATLNKNLKGKLAGRPEIVRLEAVPAGDPAKGQLRA